MSGMFKRWNAWKRIDGANGARGGPRTPAPNTDPAVRRLDEALRRSAAATVEAPSGRVSQRVMAKIQGEKWASAAEAGPMRLWGWSGIAAAACLAVIVWTFVMVGAPQSGPSSPQGVARGPTGVPDFDKWRKPAVNMLVWIDQPMLHEAKLLEQDALRAAAFVRAKFPALAAK